MPKKKNSVALFEVIHKAGEKRRAAGVDSTGSAGVRAQQTQYVGARQGDALQRVLPRPAGIANGKFGTPKKPTIWREGDRLNVSLGAVTGSVVAIGVLTLLAFAFLLGLWTNPERTPSERQAAVAITGNGTGSRTDGGPSGRVQLPVRIKGKYYLVIETMKGDTAEDRAEAGRIANFCTDRNEPAEATTFEYPDGRRVWGVWSLSPFDQVPADAERNAYASRIEKLGKDYFDRYKTYRFQQRKTPSGPLNPMFLPHK